MTERKINGGLKTALELGPVLAFFVAYLWLKDRTFLIAGTEYEGFIVVNAGFIPIFLISIGILWALTGHLSKMQAMTAIIITVFGGLSIWFNDPQFFKMKPTLIYLLFAGILGLGLALRRNWLQLVMGEALPMRAEGWRILTGRLVVLFLALAVLNEVIWRLASESAWVNFKIFGVTGILIAFFIAQGGLLRRHAVEPPPEG